MKYLLTITITILFTFTLQAQIDSFDEFNSTFNDILEKNVSQGLVQYELLKNHPILPALRKFIEEANTKELSSEELLAFRINAYNFTVVHEVVKNYPISSVQEIAGFFDQVKHVFEGKEQTLNRYEKNFILKVFNDPRLHFVLNCGALDCPPLLSSAYNAEELDNVLSKQTQLALDNPDFLRVTDKGIELSQIFNWYINDFGGTLRTVHAFINQYKTVPLENNANSSFYEYNWAINDAKPIVTESSNAAFRYVVSSTIPQGSFEFKFFNNLWSRKIDDNRATFFTTAFSGLYGLNNRLNVGLAGRFRAVSNHTGASTPFDVIGFRNTDNHRIGLTALGPIVRYAPVPKWKNFSIQSTLTFPIGRNLEDNTFIDWEGAFWQTQFFNDFTINNKFSLFTEIDLLIEDIALDIEEGFFRVSTPVTVIGSYFPNPKTTLYIISGFSPFYQAPFDYFYQVGSGAKYQITKDFEIELLYTSFRDAFILENNGRADTFNIGIRFNL